MSESQQENLKSKIKEMILITMLMTTSAKSGKDVENIVDSLSEKCAESIDRMYTSDTSEQPDQAKDTAVPAAA